jgi:hypothetical protein
MIKNVRRLQRVRERLDLPVWIIAFMISLFALKIYGEKSIQLIALGSAATVMLNQIDKRLWARIEAASRSGEDLSWLRAACSLLARFSASSVFGAFGAYAFLILFNQLN